jgi:hypothetical protein
VAFDTNDAQPPSIAHAIIIPKTFVSRIAHSSPMRRNYTGPADPFQ